MSDFGVTLSTIRCARGLSKRCLAQAAGFDHSLISRLESGQRAPSRETVMTLCGALPATPSERDRLLLAADFAPRGPGRLTQALTALDELARRADTDTAAHAARVADDLGALITTLAARATLPPRLPL